MDKQIFVKPERVRSYIKFLRAKIKETENNPLLQREWNLILKNMVGHVKHVNRTVRRSKGI